MLFPLRSIGWRGEGQGEVRPFFHLHSAINLDLPGEVSKCHAIPVFATAAHAAILVSMPTLEINAMLYRQTTLRNHRCRTRDLLLPRLLSGQVELATK
jgi:hypothetical protein